MTTIQTIKITIPTLIATINPNEIVLFELVSSVFPEKRPRLLRDIWESYGKMCRLKTGIFNPQRPTPNFFPYGCVGKIDQNRVVELPAIIVCL